MSTAAGEDILGWLDTAITTWERAARQATQGPWRAEVRSGLLSVEGDGWTVGSVAEVDAEHIVLHDPESVLRRCAADRKILERHVGHHSGSIACSMRCERSHPGVAVCNHDGRQWPCPDITNLAEGYGWTGGDR